MARNPVEPSGKRSQVDEAQVKALLDDLENAIAGFDERLQAFEVESAGGARVAARSGDSIFPDIDPNAHRKTSEPPVAAATQPAPAKADSAAASSDLLAELAQAATRQQQSRMADDRYQLETRQRFDKALRTVFDYLHQLTQHVNVLQPEVPLDYALDYQHRFNHLRWAGSAVDYRTSSQSENALIEAVALRARYATNPLIVEQRDVRADAFRKDLYLMNLKIVDETRFDVGQKTAGVRFSIEGAVPLQLNFGIDIGSGQIVVRCRNLCGLGLSAYVVAPETINRGMLDGIGRCLIGQSTAMPRELAAVAFNRYSPEQRPSAP